VKFKNPFLKRRRRLLNHSGTFFIHFIGFKSQFPNHSKHSILGGAIRMEQRTKIEKERILDREEQGRGGLRRRE